jgi:hypothetical protein
MTFDVERLAVLRRFVHVEKQATWVALIRAIPSILCWIGLVAWFIL